MSLRHRVYGLWLAAVALLSPRGRRTFAKIFQQLLGECRWSFSGPEFFILCGYSKVGKTTLATQHPVLQQCAHIENDRLIDLVDQEYAWLCSDRHFFGPMFWPRRLLVIRLVCQLLRRLTALRAPVVVDFCNQQRVMRGLWLWLAKRSGYHRTVIHVICERQEHRRRLVAADLRRKDQHREGFFLLNYLQLQRRHAQPPSVHEGDRFLTFRSDQFRPEQLHLTPAPPTSSLIAAFKTA